MSSGTDPCARSYMSVARTAGPRLQLAPPPAPEPARALAVPTEVDYAISVAWHAYETLQSNGRRLHFAIDRAEGTVAAVLEDLQGNPLDTLSASQVLRLAGGGSAS